MNCQKFEAIVSELARNQMMDADLRAEALAHTFKCSECSDRMRDQKVLSSGLNALALLTKAERPQRPWWMSGTGKT